VATTTLSLGCYLIAHPREMLVETSKRGIVGVEIIAADEVRRIVRLLEPLSLSPRGGRARSLRKKDRRRRRGGATALVGSAC
jgi:hypothetical protein